MVVVEDVEGRRRKRRRRRPLFFPDMLASSAHPPPCITLKALQLVLVETPGTGSRGWQPHRRMFETSSRRTKWGYF